MVDDSRILGPLNGIEYYIHAFQSALDNNENVIDYVQYHSPETHFDILVEGSTRVIENELHNFDTSHIYQVTNIAVKEPDYESDLYNEYNEGLIVSVDLVSDTEWHPVHPFEVIVNGEHDTFYKALAHLFGGTEEDYVLNDNTWVEDATEYYLNNN